MASKVYEQVPKERYNTLINRYTQFKENLVDPKKDPVRVFDPLPQKLVEELELIREVSRELQAKKEEDIKKQQAAQAEAETKAEAEKESTEEEKQAEPERK